MILDSSAVPPDMPDRNQLVQVAEPGLGETASAQGAVATPREASCDPHLQELTDRRGVPLRHSRLKWRGEAVLAIQQQEGERLFVRDSTQPGSWPG